MRPLRFFIVFGLMLLACHAPKAQQEGTEKVPDEAITTTKKKYPVPELIPYRKGDKWGYCDSAKNIVVPCQFDYALPFTGGIGRAYEGTRLALINRKGEFISRMYYEDADPARNGFSIVYLDGKRGVVDSTGKEIVPCAYKSVMLSSYQGAGLITIKPDSLWGFCDSTGKQVIAPQFRIMFGYFNRDEWVPVVYKDGQCGMIDKKGNWVIKPKYDQIMAFSEGYAVIGLNDKYGLINKKEEVVVPVKFDMVWPPKEGLCRFLMKDKGKEWYGFINVKGDTVIDPVFYNAHEFYKGVTIVRGSNWKDYLINTRGDTVLNPNSYYDLGFVGLGDHILVLEEGHKRVTYIDYDGNFIMPLKYEDLAAPTPEGLLIAKEVDGKYGIVTTNDVLHVPFKYDKIDNFENELALCQDERGYFYIDKNGTEYYEE